MSIITMSYPGGKTKAVTLSYDDGRTEDKRLIEIMNKHGLKGTFNINTGCFSEEDLDGRGRMSRKQAIELYTNSGHEVAVHTYTHPHLEDMYTAHVAQEILKDRIEIEKMFGTIVRGMAYPFGSSTDEVVNCLKAAGIVYSRTTESTGWFNIPTDWLRMPATCHHNDPRLPELTDRFLSIEKRSFDTCWLFYLWGHSYEYEGNHNWDIIERFAEKVGNRDDIWYATNIEVYDCVHNFKQLIYNAEGTKVYNPTASSVWIRIDGDAVEIPSGKTLNL